MHALTYPEAMVEGRTIQIRGVEPWVADALERQAAQRGTSLSAYLRQELAHVVDVREARARWLADRPAAVEGITRQQLVDIIRDARGPLPGDQS